MTQPVSPPVPQGGPASPADPDLSYEAARDQLVEVVRQLESGGVPLAESMELWQRGEQLAQVCQTWLDGARATIDQARQPGVPEHQDAE